MKYLSLAAACLVLLFATGCNLIPSVNDGDGETTISIGAILPLTGKASFYADSAQRAMEVALKTVDTNMPVQINYQDSFFTPKGGVDAYNALRQDADFDVVITGGSPVSMAVLPLSKEDSRLQMSIFTSAAGYSQPDDLAFRVSQRNEREAIYWAKYLQENNFKHLGVLYLNNDYGASFQQILTQHMASTSPDIAVTTEGYLLEEIDFRTSLSKLTNAKVDALLMIGTGKHYVPILEQALELGIDLPLLSVWSAQHPDLLELPAKATERFMYTYPFEVGSEREEVMRFVKLYQETYDMLPDAYGAQAYAAVRLSARAIEQCEDDADCLKAFFAELKDEPTVLGPLTFDEFGDVTYPMHFMQIRDGAFIAVQ